MQRHVIAAALALMLTARLGTVVYGDHKETWYNLPMQRVVERADSIYGLTDAYAVRSDGVKTYNGFVICAGRAGRYGEVVETSRGVGIILDVCEAAEDEPNIIDLAVDW